MHGRKTAREGAGFTWMPQRPGLFEQSCPGDKGLGGRVASSVPRGIRHEGGLWSSWSMPEDSQVPSAVPPLCQEGPRVEPRVKMKPPLLEAVRKGSAT